MKFRVRDCCKIILYPQTHDGKPKSGFIPQKPRRSDDGMDLPASDEDSLQNLDESPHPSSLRPPSYNPEDYGASLIKFSTLDALYQCETKEKKIHWSKSKEKAESKAIGPEMGLKQFGSVPDLLQRLRDDLKISYLSFVKEFVLEPHDGVWLLMDLLKIIQEAQTNLNGSSANRDQQNALKRTLLDEYDCLSCLRACFRFSETSGKLTSYRRGLYCLAASTMSSLTKSRTVALQLLTGACRHVPHGNRQVTEAFSTLRLRFAEPVRCKFLVSMMLSYPHPSFQIWGLRLINALLSSTASLKEKIYLQEELAEAGFDTGAIRKALEHRGVATATQEEAVKLELEKWAEHFVDVEGLENQLQVLKETNTSLKSELHNLKQANVKLLEENILVKAVGGEVGERCSALRRRLEKHGLPSAPSPTPSITDSEVSSFVTAGRGTFKKVTGDSGAMATRNFHGDTLESVSMVGDERSMSLEWKKFRPVEELKLYDRGVSRTMSTREQVNKCPPVPMKRRILRPKDLSIVSDAFAENIIEVSSEIEKSEDNLCVQADTSLDTSSSFNIGTETNGKMKGQAREIPNPNTSAWQESDDYMYQQPVQTNQDPNYGKITRRPSPLGSEEKGVNREKTPRENSTAQSSSNKSLSSSTSTLSNASPNLSYLEREERTDDEFDRYENVPQVKYTGNSANKDVIYERDVIVYEAITLGSDTILLNKNSNSSSEASSLSVKAISSSNDSKEHIDVKQSVKLYEHFLKNYDQSNIRNENAAMAMNKVDGKSSRLFTNGFLNGLRGYRKKDKKSVKHTTNNPINNDRITSKLESRVTDQKLLNMKQTFDALVTESVMKNVGKQTRCDVNGNIRESKIVPNLVPLIPPRPKSRNSSLLSSRSQTPESVSFSRDILEHSVDDDVKVYREKTRRKSFKKVYREREYSMSPCIRRSETFVERPHKKNVFLSRDLRRSESMHISRFSEYNSHRSYSPKRRNSIGDLLLAVEENEVKISGKRYMQYTGQQLERQTCQSNSKNAAILRRKNRSFNEKVPYIEYYNGEKPSPRVMDFNGSNYYNHNESRGCNSANNARTFDEPHTSSDNAELSSVPSSVKNESSRNLNDRGKKYSHEPSRRLYPQNLPVPTPPRFVPEVDLPESKGMNEVLIKSQPDPKQLSRALSKAAEQCIDGGPKFKRKMLFHPPIPTPDYSATPAGTLKYELSRKSEHILNLPSGLY